MGKRKEKTASFIREVEENMKESNRARKEELREYTRLRKKGVSPRTATAKAKNKATGSRIRRLLKKDIR